MSTETQKNQDLKSQRRRLAKMVIDEVSFVDVPAVPQSSYLLVKRDAEGLLKAAGEEKPLSDSERIARLEETISQLMAALNGESDDEAAEADAGEQESEGDDAGSDADSDAEVEGAGDSDSESDAGNPDADGSGTTQANVDGSVGDGVTTASNVDGDVTDEMATPNVKPDDEGTDSPDAKDGMAKDGQSSADEDAAAEVVADRDASEGKVDDSENGGYPWQSDEKLIAAVQADAAEQLANELDNWTGDEKKQQYIEDAANDTLSPDLVGVAHEIVAMGSDKWSEMGVDVDDESQLDALASMVGDAMLAILKQGDAAGGKGSTATGEPNLESDPTPAKDKLGDMKDKGSEDAANADGDMVDVDSAGTVENPGPAGNPMPSSNIDRTAALQSVAQDAWTKTMGDIFAKDKATDWRGSGKIDANELDFRAHDAATHFLEGSPKIGDRLNMPLVNQNDMTLTTEGVKVRDYLAGFIKQRMAAYQHALESKEATWGKLWSGIDVDTDGAAAPVQKFIGPAMETMPVSVQPVPVVVSGDADLDGDSDGDGDHTDSSYMMDSDADYDDSYIEDGDVADEVIGNAMAVAIQSLRSVADKLGPSGLSMLSGLILWAHHNCSGDAIRGEIGECITKGLAQVDDEPNEPVKVAKADNVAPNHAVSGTNGEASIAKSDLQADEDFLSQLAAEFEKRNQPEPVNNEDDWASVLSALNGLQESKQRLDERISRLRA